MLEPQQKLAIGWENYRKTLVDHYQFALARDTYRAQKTSLSDGNTGKFWDNKFAHPLPTIHFMEDWRLQKIIENLDSQKTVLNIGVGSGRLEKKLWKLYGATLNYTGTDIAQKTLEELQPTFPGWHFLLKSFEDFNLAGSSFDQVLLLEVLEHIKPSQTFDVLKLVAKVLKPDGTFMISVPVNEGLEKMLPDKPNQHMRLYSESLLLFELRQAGFVPQRIFRASAFAKGFWWKQPLNTWLNFRQPNNLLVLCRKRA